MKPEKQLYQWDVNQYLTGINPSAQFVDYPIGNEVIRIEADGNRCRIPDEVLQTYGGKTCYERYPDGTFRAYSFSVLYAPKPPDYVYTPEERTTFEALTARVDAAIDEIKRRADSGEFTPKKGVDYFTDAEKDEMMESVSSGAIGEFRKVVDTATTDYNRNAAEKLEAYNSNHAEKVAEYNQNAETKTAEFDANAAALQTEVDRLRGECDNLAAENRKQENRISALIKLNKGQTYDVLEQESEAYSVDVPSGSKYAGIDKVGGKSVVWNQLIASGYAAEKSKVLNVNYAGITTPSVHNKIANHKYLVRCKAKVDVETSLLFQLALTDNSTETKLSDDFNLTTEYAIVSAILTAQYNYSIFSSAIRTNYSYDESVTLYAKERQVFDLTTMFGAGNEPSTVEEFETMFPADYYPYSEPTIISSQTDRVEVASADGTITQQITTGFPVLNSAGSVYDYIDLNDGKLHRRVGEFILTADADIALISYTEDIYLYQFMLAVNNTPNDMPNICNRFTYYTYDNREVAWKTDGAIVSNQNGITRLATKMNMDELKTFLSANEVIIQYVLTEPVITDITIPTELTDWLPVEPGGAVTFHNSDESKKLAVPNGVSWVRKLNEVE